MEPQQINLLPIQQRIAKDLRDAELLVAKLRGQLELIQELIAPPIVTEGEDPSLESP